MREPGHQVGGGLNAPLEIGARAHQAGGDFSRAIQVYKKVVVHHPQHLQVVTARQVDGLLHELFHRQSIPLAAVDAGIGAVSAVKGTSQAGDVHGPAASAHAFVGVEVGKV